MNFYTDAAGQQPLNSDYWYRAALAAIYGSLPQTPGLLGAAIAADPCEMRYYQMRARYEASSPTPRWELVYADFRQAVDLDPHNADLRLEFADALMRSGLSADRREAREEYRAALAANDKLPPGEMRRLTPQKVRQTQQKIRELGGKTGEEN
jgi:tetratricopeptide (TPR) repeat protein